MDQQKNDLWNGYIPPAEPPVNPGIVPINAPEDQVEDYEWMWTMAKNI